MNQLANQTCLDILYLLLCHGIELDKVLDGLSSQEHVISNQNQGEFLNVYYDVLVIS